jgi:hypothetical protein
LTERDDPHACLRASLEEPNDPKVKRRQSHHPGLPCFYLS